MFGCVLCRLGLHAWRCVWTAPAPILSTRVPPHRYRCERCGRGGTLAHDPAFGDVWIAADRAVETTAWPVEA